MSEGHTSLAIKKRENANMNIAIVTTPATPPGGSPTTSSLHNLFFTARDMLRFVVSFMVPKKNDVYI